MGEEVYKRREIKESRNGLELVGRFSTGNESRANEYWRSEEEKKCRLCKKEPESLKHVLEECEETG